MELFGYLAIGLVALITIIGVIKALFEPPSEEKKFLRYLKKEMANCSAVDVRNPNFKIEQRVLKVNFRIYYENTFHHQWFFDFDFKHKTFNQYRINRKHTQESFDKGSLEDGITRIKKLIVIKN